MINCLHDLLTRQLQSRPEASALWWDGRETSYHQLHGKVQQLAAALSSYGKRGDRVGVLAWNCPEYISLLYAVPAAGRILVPFNTRLAPAELNYQIDQAGVSLLLGQSKLLEPLLASPGAVQDLRVIRFGEEFDHWLSLAETRPLPPLSGDEDCWLLFTSGTTGHPKGAVLSHRSLLAGLASAACGRPVLADDRYLYPFPLFHVSAHNVLLQHRHGAAVALIPGFDAATVLACCESYAITTMSLAPTMIAMLLDHPGFRTESLASLRTIGYGAAAIPAALLRRVLTETRVGLSQGYGMTELSGSVAFLDAEAHRLAAASSPELLASVGRPVPQVEIRLLRENGEYAAVGETGEIVVRGEQVMRGYWQQAAATAETLVEGWLHTGDIGRFDTGGYLYIVDRKKDMIISGGENVASREVEDTLGRHPDVRQAAVVGLPDETWGEQVCAMVEKHLDSQLSESELIAFCREQLAGYKTPRVLRFCNALPVNASGKIDKAEIRQLLAMDLT